MQTNTLRGKKQLLIGFTLFSMFFGAGNLIFPPYLGAQAGTRLWLAFAGFAVSAIGLPIAGVVAVVVALLIGIGSVLGIVLGIVGVVLLVTAAVGFCPIYRVFGLSTCPVKQH